MNIVIASDSFKGSLNSRDAALKIDAGVRRVFPEAEICRISVADGGEGTADAMIGCLGGHMETAEVLSPQGRNIRASYGILSSGSVIVEMAAASGLVLEPEGQRNIMTATTYGTGQLIKAALEAGHKKIYVAIGGSATNDGGIGMAQALGVSFLDKYGTEVDFGGQVLQNIVKIDISKRSPLVTQAEITIMCDVDNPLYGPNGAAAVYGPQKGATPLQIKSLDDGLRHLGELVHKQLKKDISNISGSGSAGGLGFGLMAFAGARMRRGIEMMLDICDFDEKIKSADLVITGEGQIDRQSAYGKVLAGISRRAGIYNVPVIAVTGSIGDGAEKLYQCGIRTISSAVCSPMDVQDAIRNADRLIPDAAERVMRAIALGMDIEKSRNSAL